MIRFALKTLFFDRNKLLIALLGVVFSIVLVSIQGGLFLGLIGKASMLVDHSPADIWVSRHGVENVDFAHLIPEDWLNRIRSIPEVAVAEPLVVGKTVATVTNGEYEDVWVVGQEPSSQIPFDFAFAQGRRRDVFRPDAISVDANDTWKLGGIAVGEVLELGGRRARVLAMTRRVQGFLVNPYLFTSLDAAREYCQIPSHECSYFLIRAKKGASVSRLAREIHRRLPDADVLESDPFGRKSRDYWMSRTGIGLSFGAATAIGMLVGLVMVAQSLYAMTLDRLGDYATLKAMGAHVGDIRQVLMVQATAIAAVGSAAGVVVVLITKTIAATPVAPIVIPVWLLACGVLVNFAICLGSAQLPLWRIRTLDPVTVLQG